MRRRLRDDHIMRARDAEILTLLSTTSLSYQQIGDRYDLTREMVRLVGRRAGILEERRERLRRQREEYRLWAKQAQYLTEREAWAEMATWKRCVICNSPCQPSRTAGPGPNYTCSALHATAWREFRYILDPEQHDKHRRTYARTVLARPEIYKPSMVELAHQILDGTAPPPNRRWTTPAKRARAAELGLTLPESLP